jgi:hypothetical protein
MHTAIVPSDVNRFTAVLAIMLAPWPSVPAQTPSSVRPAPVPTQITSARRVFVSNAGSDSYGPEVYYELTKYDGGPDRLYNSFYAGLLQWGRLELVGEPSQADVIYAVRFATPAVANRDSVTLVYDPQLNLTIIDPRTQVVLWSMTEHIEPARTRAGANRNFDDAVQRLLERTKLLTESPAEATRRSAVSAPTGAARQYERHQRMRHSSAGALVGFTITSLYEMSAFRRACQASLSTPCSDGRFRNVWMVNLAGAGAGALIGWLMPVRHPSAD